MWVKDRPGRKRSRMGKQQCRSDGRGCTKATASCCALPVQRRTMECRGAAAQPAGPRVPCLPHMAEPPYVMAWSIVQQWVWVCVLAYLGDLPRPRVQHRHQLRDVALVPRRVGVQRHRRAAQQRQRHVQHHNTQLEAGGLG